MRNKLAVILQRVISWGVMLLVFLFPLFFLPLTSEFYEFPKNILLMVFSLSLLSLWVIKMAVEEKLAFRPTAFDLPVLLIAGGFLLSTLAASANKFETIWVPAGTGTIIALTILYFLITHFFAVGAEKIIGAFLLSASVLGLTALYQAAGVGEILVPAESGFSWLRAKTFTPAGNPLNAAVILFLSLMLWVREINWELKNEQKNLTLTVLKIALAALTLIGLGISLFQLIAVTKPTFLPYSFSWMIAAEVLKNPRQLLFGVGPTSFFEAFCQSRPLIYNLTPWWNIRFYSSGNFYFQLVTTVGLFGLGGWLVFSRRMISHARLIFEKHCWLFLAVVFLIVLFGFLPGSLVMLFTFYTLTAVLATGISQTEYAERGKFFPKIIAGAVIAFTAASFIFLGRVLLAEIFFQRSLIAVAKGQATSAYQSQIQAIAYNPYKTLFRITYSQTNLALAASLVQRGNLSDEERQTISRLIQQAIREGKAAVALNPKLVTAWENLADIYRQITNLAGGTDKWAIATIQQAIALDPVNPNLRLSLGGLFYGQGKYDEAIRLFQQAVDLKPDFANAHYNLAAAYREKKEYTKAAAEMEITISLTDANTPDFEKAKKELSELTSKLPAATPLPSTSSGELSIPSPIPSPAIKPPLQLPEENQPPNGSFPRPQ